MPGIQFDRRSYRQELMDDLTIQDSRLTDALQDLRAINRWLGGYSTSIQPIGRALSLHPVGTPFKVLDVGSGGGDFAEELVRWADQNYPNIQLSITGIDYSPTTVDWATAHVRQELPKRLSHRITFKVSSAFEIQDDAQMYDVTHAALFMHHFRNDEFVMLLRQMNQVSRLGVIINDLHRHPIAYRSIASLMKVLNASVMAQHDGPLSVCRAFSKDELRRIAAAAGLTDYRIEWKWAFRWLLTTVGQHHV